MEMERNAPLSIRYETLSEGNQLVPDGKKYTNAVKDEAEELIKAFGQKGTFNARSNDRGGTINKSTNIRIDIQKTYEKNGRQYANIQVQINNPLAKQFKGKTSIAHLEMLAATDVPYSMIIEGLLESLGSDPPKQAIIDRQ